MKNFSPELKSLIDFVQFNHEYREVIRVARTPNADRFENDAEHSYQLAMVAWYIISTSNLNLDINLCLRYALAHDLVEVYAGDTYAFDDNKENHASKEKREQEARLKIQKRFPNFKDLVETIKEYEKKETEESKFVYALDKILPPIQVYLEDGKLWHEKNISLEKVITAKKEKVKVSPPVNKYWQEFLEELTKNQDKLFPKQSHPKPV